jgi:hypothetical protein
MAQCTKRLLATLDTSVLSTLSTLANTAKSALDVLKLDKQALVMSLEIALLPLQAQQQALSSIVNAARATVTIIPSDMAKDCPELGQLNMKIEQTIIAPLDGAVAKLQQIQRLTTEKALVNDEIAKIDEAISFFNGIIDDINSILAV